MSFRMHCPKCLSFNCEIETDKTHYFGGSRDHTQLHCRNCGKIVYGKPAIEAAARIQYVAWEAKEGEREAANRAERDRLLKLKLSLAQERAPQQREAAKQLGERQQTARERVAQRPHMIPAGPPKDQGHGEIPMSCSLGFCSTVIWVSPKRKAQIRATTKRVFCCPQHEVEWNTLTRGEGHTCSWKSCEEPAKKKSLYCSRDCSNKNARWRHAVRKEALKR